MFGYYVWFSLNIYTPGVRGLKYLVWKTGNPFFLGFGVLVGVGTLGVRLFIDLEEERGGANPHTTPESQSLNLSRFTFQYHSGDRFVTALSGRADYSILSITQETLIPRRSILQGPFPDLLVLSIYLYPSLMSFVLVHPL